MALLVLAIFLNDRAGSSEGTDGCRVLDITTQELQHHHQGLRLTGGAVDHVVQSCVHPPDEREMGFLKQVGDI